MNQNKYAGVFYYIAALILLLILVTGCSQEQSVFTGVVSCPSMSCNATGEIGAYCRVSSTGYRAYPYTENNSGYRDCINRANNVKGVWSVQTPPNVSFTPDHCLFLDNTTMCFGSSNPIEDALIFEEVQK